MKLDCYTHIFPLDFFHRMEEVVENKAPIKRWLNIPMLYDVDTRQRIMDTFGEYQQILTLSAPPIGLLDTWLACRLWSKEKVSHRRSFTNKPFVTSSDAVSMGWILPLCLLSSAA